MGLYDFSAVAKCNWMPIRCEKVDICCKELGTAQNNFDWNRLKISMPPLVRCLAHYNTNSGGRSSLLTLYFFVSSLQRKLKVCEWGPMNRKKSILAYGTANKLAWQF